MQYPNAVSGTGKIFAGEILALISSICTTLAVVLAAFAVSTVNNASDALNTADDFEAALNQAADASSVATGSILGSGALILIGGIVAIVGFILIMVGCGQAGKDETSFRNALIVYIILIALTVVGSFFSGSSDTVKLIVTTATTFCSLYAIELIISGYRKLANELNDSEGEKRGASAYKLVCVFVILGVACSVCGSIIGGTIGGILALVSLIAVIIYYIIFIGFIGYSKKMLNAH